MALGWNEIRERAARFSLDWELSYNEEADSKSFIDAFFEVFGIPRKAVASFEHKVKKLNEHDGFIDLLWKGTLLIEMKSKGKNLHKAFEQSKEYIYGLPNYEKPTYILVSDFQNFRLYDLEDDVLTEFQLNDFANFVQLFGFIAGYQKRVYKEEDPVNIRAAYLMGKLHDALKEVGYSGYELEKYLVRLLFCLFAEDTHIFQLHSFQQYIEDKTNIDGSDLGMHLAHLFQVLNTQEDKRQKTLDESIAAFPYVNGHLFEEQLSFASFNSKMRHTLLECCYLDWGKISPAIFGSMFQSVMDFKQRRDLGAHYTSEKNILKLIKPLFLDNLWKEYESVRNSHAKVIEFQKRLASLRFLDPACGCGNFLVVTYREIRKLEIEIIKTRLFKHMGLRKEVAQEASINIRQLVLCDVDRFYGIEVEEFPAQIAQVALWLMDHQMNMLVTHEFGRYFTRLPLQKSAMIVHGNALKIDWDSLLNPEKTITIYANKLNYIELEAEVNEPAGHFKTANVIAQRVERVEQFTKDTVESEIRYDYIIGNPPFIGSKLMSKKQRDEVADAFDHIEGCGVMDYASAWYVKASKYLQKYWDDNPNHDQNNTQVAFVSTNSIVQGEQVGLLWQYLISKFGVSINFAHRTFRWSNEAKGVAAVYCVVIGFAKISVPDKKIFVYDTVNGDPNEIPVSHINPYLVEGKDVFIRSRQHPICQVPEMNFGNMPLDGGNLLLTDAEKNELLANEQKVAAFIKPLISAREFLNNENRWCLWLVDIQPSDLRKMPSVMERIEKVRKFRLASVAPSTQKFAAIPSLFRDRNNPETCIVIPRVSSEKRNYIPMGFFDKKSIISDTCMSIPNGTLYHFGILMSEMHMAWVRYVCGRLESRFRYSKDIVYNNFPWPENPTEKQKLAIQNAVEDILETRLKFPNSNLADLYDRTSMPLELLKSHQNLDKSIDLAYRPQPFVNEAKRIEYLFDLYDKYTAGLFTVKKRGRK
jgi:hypothetical protein